MKLKDVAMVVELGTTCYVYTFGSESKKNIGCYKSKDVITDYRKIIDSNKEVLALEARGENELVICVLEEDQ